MYIVREKERKREKKRERENNLPGKRIRAIIPGNTMIHIGRNLRYAARIHPPFPWE